MLACGACKSDISLNYSRRIRSCAFSLAVAFVYYISYPHHISFTWYLLHLATKTKRVEADLAVRTDVQSWLMPMKQTFCLQADVFPRVCLALLKDRDQLPYICAWFILQPHNRKCHFLLRSYASKSI